MTLAGTGGRLHRSTRRLVLAVVLAGCAHACSPAGPPPASELANPGFDLPSAGTATGGAPTGWALDAAAADKGSLGLLEQQPGATGRVLQLRPNTRNAGDKLLGVGQLLDAVRWRGRTVEVTVRIGAADGGRALVGVHALGKSGDMGHVQLAQADSAGQLNDLRQSLDVPADAQFLVVYVTATGSSGSALFDSVSLSAGTATAAVTPGTAAAPESGRAQVSIDVRREVRRIPTQLFGTNAEWIFNGQGLWSDSQRALDANAVRLAREVAPTVIRFPGGVFSDYYHWRDGVGPQDKRPTTLNHPGGPKSRHVLGTQEIATVARDVGAELMLTVNAGSGTAEEAADWVRYAKSEVQPKVRLWEVGNELYMKEDLSGGAMSADQYAKKYLAFAAAMRAADPDIRVGAIGGLNYGSYRFIADDRWTETVLRQAAGQIDFLAVHNAYAPVVMGVKDSADVRTVYRAMLAAPRQIESNLRDLSKLLARYENPAKPIAVAVTEWGPFFHVLPASPWVDHVKTMGSALFVASTLNVFLREPRVELANFFKLTDLGYMGWIGRRGEQWAHTAPGMAFMLYRQSLGSTLVQAEVVSPTFGVNGLGAVNAASGVPWLDAVATFDKGVLVVMLVNKSDTLTLDGEIALKGVQSFADVSVKGISADSFDAHTGTELPAIPGLKWAKQVELSRFSRGAASEIQVAAQALPAASAAKGKDASLSYKLRPLSITAIRFGRVGLAP